MSRYQRSQFRNRSRSSALVALLVPFMVGAACAFAVAKFYLVQSSPAPVQSTSNVEFKIPLTPPKQGNEAIQMALKIYGISVPSAVVGPSFDVTLEDRGLTTGEVFGFEKTVTIGPSAFTSWGILGSTLAHEIEVHVKQSFLGIVLRDRLVDLNFSARAQLAKFVPIWAPQLGVTQMQTGTWRAERDAYQHELRNSARFGLTKDEKASIRSVMNLYFPQPKPVSILENPLSAGL